MRRKDDAQVSFTCDVRDLATAVKFFIKQGWTPKTRSEFIRKIVSEYVLALRVNSLAEQVIDAGEADEIMKTLFGPEGMNPSGRLTPRLEMNKKVDSGDIKEDIDRATKKYSGGRGASKGDPKQLEAAKSLFYNKSIFKLPFNDQLFWFSVLETNGVVAAGTVEQIKDNMLRQQEEAGPPVASTNDPEERARRDKEDLDRQHRGMTGFRPSPDEMVEGD